MRSLYQIGGASRRLGVLQVIRRSFAKMTERVSINPGKIRIGLFFEIPACFISLLVLLTIVAVAGSPSTARRPSYFRIYFGIRNR